MAADSFPKTVEVGLIGRRGCRRRRAFEEQTAQMQAALVATDQLAHVFATRAEPTSGDLLIDEGFQAFRQRDIHGSHGRMGSDLGKIWQDLARTASSRFVGSGHTKAPCSPVEK
jgi:hypothetical protein